MIHELLRRQFGVVSREQARAEGLSDSAIGRLMAKGEWERVHRGVFRHCVVGPSWEGDVIAAALATDGIASHRTAARLWGLEGFGRWKPEMTIRRGSRRRRDGVIVHESTQFDRRDAVVRSGIVCTGIERTILDLGAVLRPLALEKASESALRQRLTTWPRLHQCLNGHSRRGRDGCGVLRALLERRYGDPVVPLSTWSRDVANRLYDTALPKPLLEYRITDAFGQLILQVDLAFPIEKVAIELDSIAFHLGRSAFERDKRVRNELRRLGWVVLEVTWKQWEENPHQVMRVIADTLARQGSDAPTRWAM